MKTFHILSSILLRWFVHTKTRNKLERAGTTWNEPEPPRTSWNHLEQGGTPATRCTQQQTDTKQQELNRKKLACNTIAP